MAFSQSSPDPDTHLYVHLTPEGGHGTFLFSLIVSHVILQRENTENQWRICGQWFEVSSLYNVICLLSPMISQKCHINHFQLCAIKKTFVFLFLKKYCAFPKNLQNSKSWELSMIAYNNTYIGPDHVQMTYIPRLNTKKWVLSADG